MNCPGFLFCHLSKKKAWSVESLRSSLGSVSDSKAYRALSPARLDFSPQTPIVTAPTKFYSCSLRQGNRCVLCPLFPNVSSVLGNDRWLVVRTRYCRDQCTQLTLNERKRTESSLWHRGVTASHVFSIPWRRDKLRGCTVPTGPPARP